MHIDIKQRLKGVIQDIVDFDKEENIIELYILNNGEYIISQTEKNGITNYSGYLYHNGHELASYSKNSIEKTIIELLDIKYSGIDSEMHNIVYKMLKIDEFKEKLRNELNEHDIVKVKDNIGRASVDVTSNPHRWYLFETEDCKVYFDKFKKPNFEETLYYIENEIHVLNNYQGTIKQINHINYEEYILIHYMIENKSVFYEFYNGHLVKENCTNNYDVAILDLIVSKYDVENLNATHWICNLLNIKD